MRTAADLFLALAADGTGADLALEGGDLKLDLGLRSTVLAMLFSDARAPDSIAAELGADVDPRGVWWDSEERRYGSLLWLLEREKISGKLEGKVRAWIERALEPLLSQGIAKKVTVAATPRDENGLDVSVQIDKSDDAGWADLWQQEAAAIVDAEHLTVRILAR